MHCVVMVAVALTASNEESLIILNGLKPPHPIYGYNYNSGILDMFSSSNSSLFTTYPSIELLHHTEVLVVLCVLTFLPWNPQQQQYYLLLSLLPLV